jgi:DNA-binding NarL/FixJ family response regulator
VSSKVRIVLADDHPVVLEGLRNIVASDSRFELVGEATNGRAALKVVHDTMPDVAVLDLSMPEINGVVLTRRLAEECASVRVLLLTLHEDRAYVQQALKAGARGYALKRTAPANLLNAIRAVHVGGLYLDPSIAHVIDPTKARTPVNGAGILDGPDLASREIEVLKCTALGFTNKEIARRLDVSVKSVETYKARATEKLSLTSRAEIVRFAAGQGWLSDI